MEQKLPSRYQIGDKVFIDTEGFIIKEAEVFKVHFSESKVMYDLEIKLGETGFTRIYNVDSAMF